MNRSLTMLFRNQLVIAGAVAIALSLTVGVDAHAARARTASAGTSSNFYVPLNRSELVTVGSDIAEVIVADPEVANVVVHGKRRVSVLGVAVGQTSLRMFDANHKLIRSLDVSVTYDLPAVRRALKEFLPNERIGVSVVNTRIALTGEVSSATAAASAVEIAEEFVRGKLTADLASGRPMVDGTTIASPVINLMKISAGQQVTLRIKIGEVNRSAIRNMGVNLQAIGKDFAIATGLGTAGALVNASASGLAAVTEAARAEALLPFGTNPTPGQLALAEAAASRAAAGYENAYNNRAYQYTKSDSTFGSFSGSSRSSGRALSAQVDALERDGLLKILAEPSLTALSGEEAQFLAGGEFPIPVPQMIGAGGSQLTVQYKPYGVALKFIPYVLSKNRIRINVMPEVSDLSNENAINTSGFLIPSFVTRRASTTVELAPGESFMLAGLLRDNVSTTIDQLPGAGEIPILGALFRSTAYQRQETELVITVTPYLVDPIKDSDMKLPTDDFRPASFFESVFFGAVASNKGSKASSLEGPAGFMTDN